MSIDALAARAFSGSLQLFRAEELSSLRANVDRRQLRHLIGDARRFPAAEHAEEKRNAAHPLGAA